MNIIFIIFNRPDTTRLVFETIRAARPERLLIVADGPRPDRDGEAERCAQARAIVEEVDWPCLVEHNYSDTNLGCRVRVATGITWAFEQVEEAIILEDDTLPHPSFFRYCVELLDRYRDDERVMVITGDNFQRGIQRGSASYYFSKYNYVWGWATWRRAWRHYDVEMRDWPSFRDSQAFHDLASTERELQYWTDVLDQAYAGEIVTWDYAWTLTCWRMNGLSAMPNVNLVSNIGFRSDATHTTDAESWLNTMSSGDIGELRHPEVVSRNIEADAHMFLTTFVPTTKPKSRLRQLDAIATDNFTFYSTVRPLLKAAWRKSWLGIGNCPEMDGREETSGHPQACRK